MSTMSIYATKLHNKQLHLSFMENILYQFDLNKDPQLVTEYMTNLLKLQAHAIDLAQKSQQHILEQQDMRYEIPTTDMETQLLLNSYVII